MNYVPTGCIEKCPGCPHRSRTKEESETAKLNWLRSKLTPWEDRLLPIQGLPESERWGYRQKTTLHTQQGSDGWGFGLLRDEEVIPIPDCPVHSERVNRILTHLASTLPRDLPLVYVMLSGTLVTLVLKTRVAPDLTSWMAENLATLESLGVLGLFINLNPSAGRRVLFSRGWKLLWGQDLERSEKGLFHGPAGFQQLAPKLYDQALDAAFEFLSPTPNIQALDLYSGNGESLHRWIQAGARVLGVELGGESVQCARKAFGEQICLQGRCSERIPQLQEWLEPESSQGVLVFANPPRLGLESEISHWLASQVRPLRLAYLSCSAGTLRRDLEVFEGQGYEVERLMPYDFFPQTLHVETLALLSLRR